MQALPGSERMVGGPHMCFLLDIEPLQLREKEFTKVYMHVAYEPENKYNDEDCQEVYNAIMKAKSQIDLATKILYDGYHSKDHPLPGVFTVTSPTYRIDLRIYDMNLWAEVYRRTG